MRTGLFARKSLDSAVGAPGASALPPSLGAFQLMLMGVGGTIGTGIFVLTSEATQKAGPGMLISFLIAGTICAFAALCYAELAAMLPRAGSAYTYTFVAIGELPAWVVGWALVLEYAVTAAAVAVGWSGYLVGGLKSFGVNLPAALTAGPFAGGVVNLPAGLMVLAVAGLLVLGTRESARANAVLVVVKLAALAMFVALAVPVSRIENFTPFAPQGWVGQGGAGVLGAAASIFFAYVGFDAVATAAEETRRPQVNLPLGLIGGLAVCTLFYMAVAAGVIGSPLGAQPLHAADGRWLTPGSAELAQRCADFAGATLPLPCSRDGLSHVMRVMGHPIVGNLISLAAFLALPSVVLVLIYGQTRMFFAIARDGIIPPALAKVHPRWQTPHRMTIVTGLGVAAAAAFLPIGKLADIANAGTLLAFTAAAIALLRLRKLESGRARPFRVPAAPLISGLTIVGCVLLYLNLPAEAQLVLPLWSLVGLAIYLPYRRSRLAT